ncbi:MAG TPA: hypothetical protein DCE56_04135, partial [Cyanobacteria bacterium UBA8553]|nr:hypothetical protein [Cyanobacteria bacterium UBA8553]
EVWSQEREEEEAAFGERRQPASSRSVLLVMDKKSPIGTNSARKPQAQGYKTQAKMADCKD